MVATTMPHEKTPEQPAPVRPRRVLSVVVAIVVVFVIAESAARVVTRDLPADWGLGRVSDKAAQIAVRDHTSVVFLGDSTVEVGVDPALLLARAPELGTAYNAAVQTGSPELWSMWAGEVVVPMLRPDTVVIGVNSLSFNDAGTLRREFITRYRTSEGRSQVRGDEAAASGPATWSSLWRHRAELRKPSTWFGQSVAAITALGYDTTTADRAYSLPPDYVARMTSSVLNDYRVGGSEIAFLESLVADLRAGGIRVVLVVMPVIEDDHVPMHGGGSTAYAAFTELVDGLEDRLGVPVFQPPVELSTRAHFADPIHLNRSGTVVLTEWLAGLLTSS